ncbi:MAG: trypsin-like serine protease [Myxococcota bacterium]
MTRLLLKSGTALVAASLFVGCGDNDAFDAPDDIETQEQAVTGTYSSTSFQKGLVRLDFQRGGRCSGFFVGPNMIATAAHCVDDKTITGSHEGVWNGMKWAELRVRIVYKPSASEVICINETCRNDNGTVRYTTILAWWDNSYSGGGDHQSDVAVLTRLGGGNFIPRQPDPEDPAPRALNSNDYLRILSVAMPVPSGRRGGTDEWPGQAIGYGASADGVSVLDPRWGYILTDHWGTHEIRARYRSSLSIYSSAICAGDSGGPLVFQGAGIGSRRYAGGIASKTSSRVSSCPEDGDNMWWARLNSKMWMMNTILDWSGRSDCNTYYSDSLPGNGRYYRCW